MSLASNLPKTQGFRVCTQNKQKGIDDKQHSINFPRFNYRLSNFNTLERFYLPQQHNNNSQLQGTSQQSGANTATLAQSMNKQIKKININRYSSTCPLSTNNKRNSAIAYKERQFNTIFYDERQIFAENDQNNMKFEKKQWKSKSKKYSHKNEFNLKQPQETWNRKQQNVRQESSRLEEKQVIQQLSNPLNQQSNYMQQQNSKKRRNPFQNDYSSQTEKHLGKEPRNRRRNQFSIKRQEINSRYQSPIDPNQNEKKQTQMYLDCMQEEISESLQGQNIELLIRKLILQNSNNEQKQKCAFLNNQKRTSIWKEVKQNQKVIKKYQQNKPKEQEMHKEVYQNESNVMMGPINSTFSDENRFASFQAIFNYPVNDSVYHNQEQQQFFQLNEFLLN